MKLLILLDENAQLEKEEAIKEFALGQGVEVRSLASNTEAAAFLKTDLTHKTVLCDHTRFLTLDLSKPYINTRFVILVQGKISDVTATVPQHIEASLFLAEDLLGDNELGKTLLKRSIFSQDHKKIEFNDLIKTPIFSKEFNLKNSSEKNTVVEAIENAIMDSYTQFPPRLIETYAKKAAMICDELILNAIYDANPKMKSADRQISTALGASETVDVKLCLSEALIALSVRDQFGTFKKDSMLRYASGLNQSESISDRQSGGMGLRLSIDSSSQMLVQVEDSKFTEMISVINIYPSIKEFKQKLKSLLCFFN
jgi:hypothetical protein